MNIKYFYHSRPWTVKVALTNFEKVKGYLISATRASKYSTSCLGKNNTWGDAQVHFPRRLLVFTIITIARECTNIPHVIKQTQQMLEWNKKLRYGSNFFYFIFAFFTLC